MIKSDFKFCRFSDKQLQVLRWWRPNSPYHDYDGVIADGAVRSGKTLAMSLSFVMWAMETFDAEQFGLCGKSVGSLRRNVITGLTGVLPLLGYAVEDKRSENCLIIRWRGKQNRFFMFGGKDESSQDLIQGVTLSGIFLDEVVLMPESFVNQATGRCSTEGAKLWFSCNPSSRLHWFKMRWINKYKQKKLLYLHFTMDDNLSLSEKTKERYRNMYVGTFFKRYILGEWVSADGLIYDMFSDANLFDDDDPAYREMLTTQYRCDHIIACDYGTTNPMVYLDIYDDGDVFWIVGEYYWNSRVTQQQKTDAQYGDDFDDFVHRDKSVKVILDPSAESFRVELKNRGYHVVGANNEVLDGIRMVSTLMQKRKIRIHKRNCPNIQKELGAYAWDEKAAMHGVEQPVKQQDHALDALRYSIKTTVHRWRLTG